MEIVARENIVTVIDHHTRQRTTTEEPDPMEVPLPFSREGALVWGNYSTALQSALRGEELS